MITKAMCGCTRPLFIILCALMLTLNSRPPCWARPSTLVIYYANETMPNAIGSPNYQALFSVLKSIPTASSASAMAELREDARSYRALIHRDIDRLMAASRIRGFDLAVFSNELAFQGKFLFSRDGKTTYSNLAPLIPQNPVTAYFPLSLSENFRMGLMRAASDFGRHDRLVLIVSSHGAQQFAIIPRVAADFTSSNDNISRQELIKQRENDLDVTHIPLNGIAKDDFWRIIAEVSEREGIAFSLVGLESCEGAPNRWSEFAHLFGSVRAVAHSGFETLDPWRIDYSELSSRKLTSGDHEQDVVSTLEAVFSNCGMHVDARYALWIWPLWHSAAAMPHFVYFIPMVLWLGSFGLERSRSCIRKRPSFPAWVTSSKVADR